MLQTYMMYISIFMILFLSSCASDTLRSLAKANPTPDTQQGDGNPLGSEGGDKTVPLVPYTYTESFTGNNQQQLDILMVIDNSGSMTEEIAAVTNQLGNFVSRLQTRRAVDYQVAVTTTNFIAQTRPASDAAHADKLQASKVAATLNQQIVKSATDANPVQAARDILSSIPFNPTWAGYEMGIYSAVDVIQSVGSQFMRPKTDLAIITLSDEDDHSDPFCRDDVNGTHCTNYARKDIVCPLADGSCPYYDVNVAKQVFQGLNRSVLYKPLVGLPTPRCSTVATIGNRYIQLANLLGSAALDVCAAVPANQTVSPLEQNLLGIADSISARGICFPMTVKATGKEILVAVVTNGNSQPMALDPINGYTFDDSTNAICFPGSVVIDSMTRIDVSYQSLH